MPRPSHRIDVVLAVQPADRDPGAPAIDALWADLIGHGLILADGSAGPSADRLVAGGFARARTERHDAPVLYANLQGGFHVSCPVTGANVVPAFTAAVRDGRMACPACGGVHALPDLAYAPPAAWSRAALVLADAEAATVGADGRAVVDRHLGPVAVVVRRV